MTQHNQPTHLVVFEVGVQPLLHHEQQAVVVEGLHSRRPHDAQAPKVASLHAGPGAAQQAQGGELEQAAYTNALLTAGRTARQQNHCWKAATVAGCAGGRQPLTEPPHAEHWFFPSMMTLLVCGRGHQQVSNAGGHSSARVGRWQSLLLELSPAKRCPGAAGAGRIACAGFCAARVAASPWDPHGCHQRAAEGTCRVIDHT